MYNMYYAHDFNNVMKRGMELNVDRTITYIRA